MGYNVGEGVLDYSYCEEDVVNSAKANIRGFIQIIIGAIIALGLLSFLFSTLIGSLSCLGGCLGCETCIQTAACADECSCVDCDYESLTEEQVQNANDRVACDGYDCCGREGCLACGGCGDCSQCSGYDYDTITIVVGSTSYEKYFDEYTTHISVDRPSGMESPYYSFLGLFDEDGDRYVNEYGTIEKDLKDGLVLYAKFEETNLGVQYELLFNLEELGMSEVRIAVTVGGMMPAFPEVPERDGYRFKGWYNKDNQFITDGKNLPSTFHLSDFKMNPNYSNRVCELFPQYEAKTQKVAFYYNGSYCMTVEMAFDSKMEDVFAKFYSEYYDVTRNENFFGWATEEGVEPDQKVAGDALLKEDMKLYAIIREAITFQFSANKSYNDGEIYYIKLYEGATNVVFADLEELAGIKEESANPGYKFVGWYTDRNPSEYDQAIDSIARVEKNSIKYYYAKWERAEYTLTYWVMDYKAGELDDDFVEYYHMGDVHELVSKEEVLDNIGYEFAGWCFDEECLGTVYTDYLPNGTYGNKDLYAKYIPDTYTVTLIAPGGSFNSNYTGSNVGGDHIAYGSTDNINKAYKEGYNFVGWFYGDVATGVGEQITDGNGDLLKPFTLETLGLAITTENEAKVNKQFSLFAKWEIKKFDIEFMVGDMTYEHCEVEWGKQVARTMPNPEKEGHTFLYWTYADGSRYYDTHVIKDGANSYVVDGKVVLTAVFEINKHTVTFVIDGVRYDKKVTWGTTLADAEKLLTEPPYSGTPRKRVGWFVTETYDVEMESDQQVKANVTLYAKYEYAKKFTFYGAGGTYERHYFVGDKETFPTDSKKGYTFEGWCEDASLTSAPVLEDVRIRDNTATEYYAKHKTIAYKIEYYLSNSDAQPWKTDTYTIEDNKVLIEVDSSQEPKKTGYDFGGWKWNGSLISQLVNMTEDKKLYAVFTANSYVVTLNDEGDGALKYATYDASFNFGVPAVAKEGYDFVGWAWERGASDTEVVTDNTGKSLAGVVFKIAEDTNAYPVFRLKQYSAFWKDPADGRIIEQTVIKHFEYVQPPTNPIKEGYTFEGWYKDQACTQAYDFYASTVTGDVQVWAKFSINSYDVTFVVDTGLQYVAYDLVYNTSLASAMQEAQATVDEFVARTQARFVNWLTDDGAIYTASDVVPARNLTLTAKFHMPITVRYNLHDGSVQEDDGYYAGDTIYAYSYTRKGYSFDGWYTISNTKQSFPLRADENTPEIVELYARWTANTYTIYYHTRVSYWQEMPVMTRTYTMDQTEKYGGYELLTPDPVDGKVFKGWYIGYYGSGTPIDTIDNYGVDQSEVLYGNIELYGEWEDVQYSVKFVVDGIEQTSHELTFKNGDTLTNLNWTPTVPTGKTFLGWRIKGTQTIVIDSLGYWQNHTYYDWTTDIVLEAWFI